MGADLIVLNLPYGLSRERREILREVTEQWGSERESNPGAEMALVAVQKTSERVLLLVYPENLYLGALSYRKDYYNPDMLKVTSVGVIQRGVGLGFRLMQALFRIASEQRSGVTLYPRDEGARSFFTRMGMRERWEGDALYLDLGPDEVEDLSGAEGGLPVLDLTVLPE